MKKGRVVKALGALVLFFAAFIAIDRLTASDSRKPITEVWVGGISDWVSSHALHKDTVESVSRRYVEAIASGDAKTALACIDPDEVQASNLDEEKLQELLNEVLLPTLSDFKQVGGTEINAETRGSATIRYASSDGRKTVLSTVAVAGTDGTKVKRAIDDLIYSALVALAPAPDVDKYSFHWMSDQLKVYDLLLPKLNALTLRGVGYKFGESGEYRVRTWDEVRARLVFLSQTYDVKVREARIKQATSNLTRYRVP